MDVIHKFKKSFILKADINLHKMSFRQNDFRSEIFTADLPLRVIQSGLPYIFEQSLAIIG